MTDMNSTTEVATHTPGPWTCKVGVMGPYVDQARRTVAAHYVINQTQDARSGSPVVTESEAYANARVIAAAPDLVEAGKALLKASIDYGVVGDDDLDAAWDALVQARDGMARAIAKAEGGAR